MTDSLAQPVATPSKAPRPHGPGGAPLSDIDPFDETVLADPFPAQTALREAGPVVWLERYGIWVMGRHAEVHATLSDWQTFCSARGVGLQDFSKEPPWRPPSLILEADPPNHTRTRAVLSRILSPAALRGLRASFAAEAARIVGEAVALGRFDAVAHITERFPLKVFPDAVGLPPDERPMLLAYGAMVFNAFGPRNRLFEESTRDADRVRAWIMSQCSRAALSPGGFGMRIYEAADAGEITQEEAPMLVRSFLSAGVDTTVGGLGWAIDCLARHPDQFRRLREKPELARAAFEEVLRCESPVQTFFRTATRDVEVAGTRIREGDKVLLLLGAANRDPRKFPDPERFDITRNAGGHVAFGAGIHGCVGQMVARLEGEMVLGELARRAGSITLDGTPTRRLNNTLRSLSKLPVVVEPAP